MNRLMSQFDDRLSSIGIDTPELVKSALGKCQGDRAAGLGKFSRPTPGVPTISIRVWIHFYIKTPPRGGF
jgi:hypothetical protein